jgi:DNA-directed RNA polymerase subunit RPC12/RpoP
MPNITKDEWLDFIRTYRDPSMPFRASVFMRDEDDTVMIYCAGCGPELSGAHRGVIFDARGVACHRCGVRLVHH